MHTVRHFEIIQALAVHRHFGRAATALRISQPSLTRSLKELESRLGVLLFERRDVEPTIFGKMALRYGEPVLTNVAELMREIDLAKGLQAGRLAVSAGPYPTDICVRKAIALLAAKHPGLSIEFRHADWVKTTQMVLAGEVDVGVADVHDATKNADLEAELVRDSPMNFFCSSRHPLAARSEVTMDDLVDYPWVGPSLPGRMRAFIPAHAEKCGSLDVANDRFVPRILAPTFTDARDIVLAGRSIGGAVPFQLEREISQGICTLLPIEAPWLRLRYGFITRRGRTLSPPARAFIDLVRQIEKNQTAGESRRVSPPA